MTVAGSPVTANFSVPDTAKLSGSFRLPEGIASPFLEIRAIDATAPEPGCAGPEMWATRIQPDPSGSYQNRLLRGRAHRLLGQFSLMDRQNPMIPIGRVTFPSAGQSVTLNADATVDLNVPPLPRLVSISGKVVDNSGKPASVNVTAAAHGVTGAPNAMFWAEAQTDPNGNYRARVLSGSSYQISFLPRLHGRKAGSSTWNVAQTLFQSHVCDGSSETVAKLSRDPADGLDTFRAPCGDGPLARRKLRNRYALTLKVQ